MTKKNSLYFGLVDVDVQPNFKFSQVRAVKISIPHLKSKSDCALRIDKDEEIMDNSECPENEDLPVENTQSNNIIRLPTFGLACLFGDKGSGESTKIYDVSRAFKHVREVRRFLSELTVLKIRVSLIPPISTDFQM